MKIINLRRMTGTGAAALGALVMASCPQASAAEVYGGGLKDQPVPPPFLTWRGFYIGGHVGGAFADLETRQNVFNFNEDPVVFGGDTISSSSVFGGLQGGYNWQADHCCWVYGVEIDLGGMDADLNRTFVVTDGPGNNAAIRFESRAGFYGDVTSRLGYAWNNALIYAKGGFAWFVPNVETTEFINGVAVGQQSTDEALAGWTAGGGVEWRVSPNWSIKAEYLFFDFGRSDRACCNDGIDGNVFRINRDLTVNSVKFGFNFLVQEQPAPLK